jgi:hypothetical protein
MENPPHCHARHSWVACSAGAGILLYASRYALFDINCSCTSESSAVKQYLSFWCEAKWHETWMGSEARAKDISPRTAIQLLHQYHGLYCELNAYRHILGMCSCLSPELQNKLWNWKKQHWTVEQFTENESLVWNSGVRDQTTLTINMITVCFFQHVEGCSDKIQVVIHIFHSQQPDSFKSVHRTRYYCSFFFSLGWGETESTWYVGQYLDYCTSPGWWWV